MIKNILNIIKAKDLSYGTKIITTATAIRWAGWGFAESLIPVFLFSFSGGFAEAGLLKSSLEISMILTMPIIGIFADRIRTTTLILIGLAFYTLVGASYFLAGITSLAIFIIVARIANGIGYGLDIIGRETYFRRNNTPSKLASVFGYFDSNAIFWWIIASFVGIFLVKSFPINWILFLITPTTLISFWMIWKWRKKDSNTHFSFKNEKVSFRNFFRELGDWNYRLKMIMLLNLILSASWSIIIFFLPIGMYIEGANYTTIILFGVATATPVLSGIFLGRFFDKKGPRVFVYGLLLYGLLLIPLSLGESFPLIITTAFVIGIIQEFISVGKEELVTIYAKPEHFGKVGGLMRSIMNIGAMIGPLMAGIIIDKTGSMSIVFVGLASCMLMLAFTFAIYGRLRHRKKTKSPLGLVV